MIFKNLSEMIGIRTKNLFNLTDKNYDGPVIFELDIFEDNNHGNEMFKIITSNNDAPVFPLSVMEQGNSKGEILFGSPVEISSKNSSISSKKVGIVSSIENFKKDYPNRKIILNMSMTLSFENSKGEEKFIKEIKELAKMGVKINIAAGNFNLEQKEQQFYSKTMDYLKDILIIDSGEEIKKIDINKLIKKLEVLPLEEKIYVKKEIIKKYKEEVLKRQQPTVSNDRKLIEMDFEVIKDFMLEIEEEILNTHFSAISIMSRYDSRDKWGQRKMKENISIIDTREEVFSIKELKVSNKNLSLLRKNHQGVLDLIKIPYEKIMINISKGDLIQSKNSVIELNNIINSYKQNAKFNSEELKALEELITIPLNGKDYTIDNYFKEVLYLTSGRIIRNPEYAKHPLIKTIYYKEEDFESGMSTSKGTANYTNQLIRKFKKEENESYIPEMS